MPLILGVVFTVYIGFDFDLKVLVVVMVLLLLILNVPVFSRLKSIALWFGFIATSLFFIVGAFLTESANSLNSEKYFFKKGEQFYQVRINEPIKPKVKSVQLKVDVFARNDTASIGSSIVYLEKTNEAQNLKYGDVLLIQTKFNTIQSNGNPLEFNYGEYLNMFDIHHQTFIKNNKWQLIGHKPNSLFKMTYGISNYLGGLIQKSELSNENKSVAKALLIGQKEDLDKDTLRTYSSAGAMHVLAVSGLHVGIVMYILMFVLKPIKRFKFGKNIFVLSVLFGVWFYAFVTGLSPSVLRSSLMFSFIIIGNEIERETNVYQSILVSAFILILIDPLVIFKVGFQLSYLAVLGIVYLQPKIYNLIYIKYKWGDYLWQITAVSIAAQIATFPLGVYYFHQFPNLFFLSNLIVIPLAALILGVGIGYFIFHKIPILNDVLLWFLDWILTIMNYCVKWVENLPGSISWGYSITWYETFMIYITIIFALFSFTLKKSRLIIVSGLSCLVLLGFFYYKKQSIDSINEMVIYNIKDELAIDIYIGHKNLFLATKNLMNDEDKLLFHIQHYWFYKSGNEKANQFIELQNLKTPVFKLNETTFSILDSAVSVNKYRTNYVIVGKSGFISKEMLKEWRKAKTILILHPKCGYKTLKYITKNYPKKLIYDIKNNGAFIFSF